MNKFSPQNYKYKKIHKKIRIKKVSESKSPILKFSEYGLKATSSGVISSVVLEAARRSITRKLKRQGNLKINIFPSIPITSKSSGVRMGKGVGSISGWVSAVKKGKILFELNNISHDLAKAALLSASYKLPIKSQFIFK